LLPKDHRDFGCGQLASKYRMRKERDVAQQGNVRPEAKDLRRRESPEPHLLIEAAERVVAGETPSQGNRAD
jgi:hypothetical protein